MSILQVCSIEKYLFTYTVDSFTILDNLYIVDHGNNRFRKVAASTSIISTIAGTGAGGYNGDNIRATSATVTSPIGVAVDSFGKNDKSYYVFCYFPYF